MTIYEQLFWGAIGTLNLIADAVGVRVEHIGVLVIYFLAPALVWGCYFRMRYWRNEAHKLHRQQLHYIRWGKKE